MLSGVNKIYIMKGIICTFLLLNISLILNAQKIIGRVTDKETNTAVPSATVYLSGTFIGTTTDTDGNFTLDISKYPLMPLSVSAMGYYSVNIENFPADKKLLIKLTPRIYELNAIIVKANSLKNRRKEYMEIFKREFLGSSVNARSCKILNDKDIQFDYTLGSDTIKAFSEKPLIIDNKSLGYKVTYFLDEFEYCKKSRNLYFVGNIVFNEEAKMSRSKRRTFEKQRRSTFLGSRMHFMRALWKNDISTSGFKIYGQKMMPLNYDNLVMTDSAGKKYLIKSDYFLIQYRSDVSYLSFKKDFVYFDNKGFFYPLDLLWTGSISDQRIADYLPYEYSL
jgi:hypothetical protein